MKALVYASIFLLSITSLYSQNTPERINYAHQYNPEEEIDMHVIYGLRPSGEYEIMIGITDRTEQVDPEYDFSFYGLSNYEETLEGNEIYPISSQLIKRLGSESVYSFRFSSLSDPLIISEVKSASSGLSFYENIDFEERPFPALLINTFGIPMLKSYLNEGKYDISAAVPITFDIYDHEFPVALPPMSTSEPEVARTLSLKSSFQMDSSFNHIFDEPGLYVGRSADKEIRMVYRIQGPYFPEYVTISDLIEPLVYITTREERERLMLNIENKQVFDRFWLDMTGSKENAKWIIKNYYRRVAEANDLFTSYKEGWKTDRGMLYIIFGPPDEVIRTGKQEIWSYKGGDNIPALIFKFVTLRSPYAPRQYVLERNPVLAEDWIKAVKIWRQGMPINDL
ncbi:GWxTD domain-containing protein [Fulvivirga sedimenti]|uniref:GWxTD domain-containing protein n=1 Tax=Fulvivirga sedimenti TaxID=2879465 RepID=A0A9X1HUE2_9BACT|nr:GWxTD domain-containing protein [Fulvivirga sedimenti]MCA6078120.1 GWxTD domain-containing protein [Fulvivirga sedimenti]